MRRLILAAAALPAAPATAGAAPMSVAGPEGIAMASGGNRVVWVENLYEDDEVAIRMRGVGGGALLGKLKLPAATDGEVSARIAANGLGYLIVMYTGQADMVVRGTWNGAPETLLDCRGDAANQAQRVAAGATGFAFAGPRCFGGGTTVATIGITGPP